jgi:hypothetical protein
MLQKEGTKGQHHNPACKRSFLKEQNLERQSFLDSASLSLYETHKRES